MQNLGKYKVPVDYFIMFGICILFIFVAFIFDTPQRILEGYVRIHLSRSILITDYIALAGLGAALVNSAILASVNLLLLILNRRETDGKVISALFLTLGFSLFGKNLFNTIPIMAGVWVYGRVSHIKFPGLVIHAMISTTVAPIVSEVAFLGEQISWLRIIAAYALGILVGFIFPVVAEYVKRLHSNFCLYNGGIAGGFIATMFAGLFKSLKMDLVPESYWDTTYTWHTTGLAVAIAVPLIIYGVATFKPADSFNRLRRMMDESDPDDTDFFVKYGKTSYKNIGIMSLLSIAVMLFLRVPINGPILGGIFTISGFAANGKHLRNTIPILIGSTIAAHFNHLSPNDPVNALAILFSTGLAPIASKYGWQWGVVAGFLHVAIAVFIGDINGGLNLYNNGFAGSFVAVMILPIIEFFRSVYAMTRAKIRGRKLR